MRVLLASYKEASERVVLVISYMKASESCISILHGGM